MAKVGSLNVDLTLETARFQKGLKGAQANMSGFQKSMAGLQDTLGGLGKAMAGAFAVSAITNGVQKWHEMSRAALDAAGGMGEAAAQIGISTSALQEYRYAATQVGLSSDEMDKSLGQLTKRLGEAAQGSKAPTEALKLLGLTLSDVAGKSAADVIPLIAEGMKGIPDAAQRAAIATDLFGKAGQNLLPLLEQGRGGVDGLREAAHKLGVVMSEEAIARADEAADQLAAQDKLIEAQRTTMLAQEDNVKATMAYSKAMVDLELAAYKAFAGFTKGAAANDAMFARWRANTSAGFTQFTEGINKLGRDMAAMVGSALGNVARLYNGVKTWLGDKLNAVWNGLATKIQWVADKFKWLDDVVVRHSYVPDMVKSIADWMGKLETDMVGKAGGAANKTAAIFQKLRDDLQPLMANLFPESAALTGYNRDAQVLDQGHKDGKLTDAQLEEGRYRLSKQLAGNLGHDTRSEIPISSGVRNQGSLYDPDKVGEQLKTVIPATQSWADKMGQLQLAFGQIGGEFGNLAQSIVGSISAFINPAVDSSINKFAQLQTAMQGITSLLQSIFGKKAGGIIGGLLQIGSAVGSAFGAKIPGFANGTNFAPGGLSIVGERGPELVNLNRGAQVISNSDLRSMGRQNVHVTVGVDPRNGNVTAYVDGRIAASAPALIDAGGQAGVAKMAYQQRRRFA